MQTQTSIQAQAKQQALHAQILASALNNPLHLCNAQREVLALQDNESLGLVFCIWQDRAVQLGLKRETFKGLCLNLLAKKEQEATDCNVAIQARTVVYTLELSRQKDTSEMLTWLKGIETEVLQERQKRQQKNNNGVSIADMQKLSSRLRRTSGLF